MSNLWDMKWYINCWLIKDSNELAALTVSPLIFRPLPQTVWRKDGQIIHASEKMTQNNYGKSLVIKHAAFEDAGSYTCEVSNGVGAAKSYSINLQIMGKLFYACLLKFWVLILSDKCCHFLSACLSYTGWITQWHDLCLHYALSERVSGPCVCHNGYPVGTWHVFVRYVFFFQALNFLLESFGLLDNLFPFPPIQDAGYPVFDLHLANSLFNVILPSILESSLWSFGEGFPIKYHLNCSRIWHPFYVTKPT